MATSQADMILERLKKLARDEWKLLVRQPAHISAKNKQMAEHPQDKYPFLMERSPSSYLPGRSFAERVLKTRTKARERSAKLLYDLVQMSNPKTSSALGTSRSHRLRAEVVTPGWWAWLERLEGELMEQKVLTLSNTQTKCVADFNEMWLACTRRDHIHKQTEKDRHLAAWRYQQDRRQLHSMQALKLVLKFKADKHARFLELRNDCLERITGLSFPRELLTQVLEANIESQVPYWRIDHSASLSKVADTAFSKWPEGFGGNLQCLVRDISARAILERSLIIIPAVFTLQFTLTTPPKVQGNEHHIRYLVLDLRTTPHDGAHNRELSRCSQSMASLKSLFQNLESCVILIHLVHNTGHITGPRVLTDALGRPTFVVSTLSYRNVKSIGNVITLEQTFIEFVATFLRQGPGKRNFVRFTHSSLQNPALKRIGPLVDMSSQEPISSRPSMESLTLEEDRFTVDAKRVFQEAYWGKGGRLRGDWNKAFREG
jgi:hypothetical protein